MARMDLSDLAGPIDRAELSLLQTGEPLVLEAPRPPTPGDARRAASILCEAPTVTVLVDDPDEADPTLVAAVDVCLTDRVDPPRPWVTGAADPITGAVRAQPGAALALVALLRTSDTLDVWAAVAAEAATYSMLLASEGHQRWLEGRPDPRPRADLDPVRLARDGDLLRITLDRPSARNALDRHVRDTLVAAFDLADADPSVRAVHLAGRGPDFCAGGDLEEFGTTTDPATAFATRLSVHPGAAAHRVADRLTAHLHGHCIGAGIEIPAFAGTVVATVDTRIALPEIAMGLVPGAGGTVSLPRRIGRRRTAWLALTGSTLDAASANRWGLVDRIADEEDQAPALS